MRTASLLIAILLAGCHGYRAGSFSGLRGSFAGEHRTVGCLDIAVEPTEDAAASGPVAGLILANRCDVGVVVDIAALAATGRYVDGVEVRLVPFDPALELRPAMLEARSIATEHIELVPVNRDDVLFSQWCLDLARLDRARPSEQPVIVCFANGVRA